MELWQIPTTAIAAGAGLAAYGAMHPAAQVFGPTVRRGGDRGGIALTFDDGPNPSVTPALLDLLDGAGCRATFFLIGRFVGECPALAREISTRGHLLGNHTHTHPNLIWLSPQKIGEELQRSQEAIRYATGCAPRWMRPPYGFRGPQLGRVLRRFGLRGPVMWTVSAHDWVAQSPARLVRRLQSVRGGDIVLLHDGDHRRLGGDREQTLRALAHWLPRWRDAGLHCVTLDHLFAAGSLAPETNAAGL
jgi:peptidoglycan/xylan/chitin deacetylase (PgdA/CDA1 family)